MVSGDRSRTAVLVLIGDARALAGSLQGEDGVERRFSGWMELAAAIEEWRAGTEASRDQGSTTSGSPASGCSPHGER
jgi:hypothetical protein